MASSAPSSPARGRSARGIVGDSPAVRHAIRLARRYAVTPAPVLIQGDRGTGKELFARLIHEASGRDGEFVALNCSTLPSELTEAELFGHVRGAFTGAGDARPGVFGAADGGTLLLDEVGDLSLQAQAKLLRVLQEGVVRRVGEAHEVPVDVRVVAATWRDLDQMAREGKFREDLLDRLAWCRLDLPPLRERGRDVLQLARHYLAHGRELAHDRKGLVRDAEPVLLAHSWPGNVRELQRTLFRAAVEGKGRRVSAADLRGVMAASIPAGDGEAASEEQYQEERLLDLLSELGEASVGEIESVARASRSQVKRILSRLMERGDVLRRGRGRSTTYRAARPSGSSAGPWEDPRWIIARDLALAEGRITRGHLAEELEVSERTASRVLAAMVDGGVLVPDGNRGKARGYLLAVNLQGKPAGRNTPAAGRRGLVSARPEAAPCT